MSLAAAERLSRDEWQQVKAVLWASPEYQEYLREYSSSASCVVPRPPEHLDFYPIRHPTRAEDLWIRRDGKKAYVVLG